VICWSTESASGLEWALGPREQRSETIATNNPLVAPRADEPRRLLWNSHPINLAVGVAWLQIGIGLVLLVSNGNDRANRRTLSAFWAALVCSSVTARRDLVSGRHFFSLARRTVFYAIAGVWLFLKPRSSIDGSRS